MKKFMMLQFGFEQPTPDVMEKWNQWFAAVAERTVEHGGFMNCREISHDGTVDLPFGADSITGYSIIEAEDMAEAERLAEGNPFIKSLRIYEVRNH